MQQPNVEIIPCRPAVCTDRGTDFQVLIRITPPVAETECARPALNLGLVLDRSGSMAGLNKIDFARQAAAFAVEQLSARDRVSLTVFDSTVETLFPNAPAENKAPLLASIRRIGPRYGTDLHGGWKEGGRQVVEHRVPNGLNRVVLLSDGQANVGITEPDALATDVHCLVGQGVSTTTIGLGADYNADLLEAMARSGDGNYYYVESPEQLPAIFETELQGLMAAFGYAVTLSIEPGDRVVVKEILNELDQGRDRKLRLPNLIGGVPVQVLVCLNVSFDEQEERNLGRFSLEWADPSQGERQSLSVSVTLPAVAYSQWEKLAFHVDVQEQATLLTIARYKKEATRRLEMGHQEEAVRWIRKAQWLLNKAPRTAETQREYEALAQLESYIGEEAWGALSKMSGFQSYQRSHSRPYR